MPCVHGHHMLSMRCLLCSYAAVYDGHEGSAAVDFAVRELHKRLDAEIASALR